MISGQLISILGLWHMGSKFENEIEKDYVEKYLGDIANNEFELRNFNI